MKLHLRSVAIMIEVTSRHMECARFNLKNSRMPAVAPQWGWAGINNNCHFRFYAINHKNAVVVLLIGLFS